MSQWIHAKHHFDDRTLLLVATRNDLINHGLSLDSIRQAAQEGPDFLEAAFRTLMVAARPELKDAVILYIGFNPEMYAWEALVSHISLPRRAPFAQAKREYLWPVEEPTTV